MDIVITIGKKLGAFIKKGWFALSFAIFVPLFNGVILAMLTTLFIEELGNRLLLSILASSASNIAVPVAMKLAAPKANSSLYIPMALAITFPFDITLGMPLYLYVIHLLPSLKILN